MNWNDVDKLLPKLSPIDIATAINTCREAGAVNAASALSKHISRIEMELEIATKKLAILTTTPAPASSEH